jgi:hypothetical protein
MIRRTAMVAWECKCPPGPNVLTTDIKISNQEPQWDNNDATQWDYMRDLRDLIIKGI